MWVLAILNDGGFMLVVHYGYDAVEGCSLGVGFAAISFTMVTDGA